MGGRAAGEAEEGEGDEPMRRGGTRVVGLTIDCLLDWPFHVTSPTWRTTLAIITVLDPFGPVVRPEQRLGTSVTHFVSSWTGMTQEDKFEDR
jgi:hypothetical protein